MLSSGLYGVLLHRGSAFKDTRAPRGKLWKRWASPLKQGAMTCMGDPGEWPSETVDILVADVEMPAI